MSNALPLYDLTTFREMDAEDPGALAAIVGVFLNTTPAVLNELNTSFANNNLEQVAHLAHKLKATIDIFQMGELTTVIRSIESAAKSGQDPGQLPALMSTFNQTLNLVFDQMRKEIE